jgi:Cdc6-like AAA superfamily ATPase
MPHVIDENIMKQENIMKEWLESFAMTASDMKFQHTLDQRAPDTCQWIEGDASFTWWRAQNTSAALWLTGLPGIGKTTIATHVVQLLRAEINATATPSVSNNIVLFVICNDQTMKSGEEILCNVISQVLPYSPSDLQKSAMNLEQTLLRGQGGGKRNFEILWEIFAHLVQNSCFSCIYFVIDGLDECENNCVG